MVAFSPPAARGLFLVIGQPARDGFEVVGRRRITRSSCAVNRVHFLHDWIAVIGNGHTSPWQGHAVMESPRHGIDSIGGALSTAAA
jgi:hypothetical protein